MKHCLRMADRTEAEFMTGFQTPENHCEDRSELTPPGSCQLSNEDGSSNQKKKHLTFAVLIGISWQLAATDFVCGRREKNSDGEITARVITIAAQKRLMRRDQNSPTTSPPARVPKAPQTPNGLRPPSTAATPRFPVSMFSEINRTEPSASRAWAPPVW